LPLVIILVAIALLSLISSTRNPLNGLRPLTGGGLSSIGEMRKAISMQRVESIGQAVERFNDIHGRTPHDLAELAPHYIDTHLLRDPWGQPYSYVQPANRVLVIGFTADRRTDTDLLLSLPIGAPLPTSTTTTQPQKGGISLIE
jgi:hypothetical protein